MHAYEHTQPGTFIRVWVGLYGVIWAAIAAAMWVPGVEVGGAIACGVLAAICAVIVPLFHSLTVRFSRDAVLLSFGVGLIRKRFPLDEIRAAGVVRNPWYYGWGIKKIPGGWLFNVSGLDAVEIQLKHDRTARIGTDQPRELCAAIEAAALDPGRRE